LFQDGPEQGFRDLPCAAESGSLGLQILESGRVEAITRAGIFHDLRPELVQSHTFAHAKPELPGVLLQPRTGANGWGWGGHGGPNIIGCAARARSSADERTFRGYRTQWGIAIAKTGSSARPRHGCCGCYGHTGFRSHTFGARPPL